MDDWFSKALAKEIEDVEVADESPQEPVRRVSVVEKRVDPLDGSLYTFDELLSFYKGQFGVKAIGRYWEQECFRQKQKARNRRLPRRRKADVFAMHGPKYDSGDASDAGTHNAAIENPEDDKSDAVDKATGADDASEGQEHGAGGRGDWFVRALPQAVGEVEGDDESLQGFFCRLDPREFATRRRQERNLGARDAGGHWFESALRAADEEGEEDDDEESDEDDDDEGSARSSSRDARMAQEESGTKRDDWFAKALAQEIEDAEGDDQTLRGMFTRMDARELSTRLAGSESRRGDPITEKRKDPLDGLSYTFDELRDFYKGQFGAKAIQRYWDQECIAQSKKKKTRAHRRLRRNKAVAPSAHAPTTCDAGDDWFAMALGAATEDADEGDSGAAEEATAGHDAGVGSEHGGAARGDWFVRALPREIEEADGDDESLQGMFIRMDPKGIATQRRQQNNAAVRDAGGNWFSSALQVVTEEAASENDEEVSEESSYQGDEIGQGDTNGKREGWFAKALAQEIEDAAGDDEALQGMFTKIDARELPMQRATQVRRRRDPTVEKRVDPFDGMLYSFDELCSFYKGQFGLKAIRKYWEQECCAQSEAKHSRSRSRHSY